MYGSSGDEKTEHRGEENMEEDIWSSGRTRNMKNEKESGIAGAMYRFGVRGDVVG